MRLVDDCLKTLTTEIAGVERRILVHEKIALIKGELFIMGPRLCGQRKTSNVVHITFAHSPLYLLDATFVTFGYRNAALVD